MTSFILKEKSRAFESTSGAIDNWSSDAEDAPRYETQAEAVNRAHWWAHDVVHRIDDFEIWQLTDEEDEPLVLVHAFEI
jgi:hypothetical protein